MLTKNILLRSFSRSKAENKIKKKLKFILKEKSQLFKSMSKDYIDNYVQLMIDTMNSDKLPESNESCENCAYARMRGESEK